MNRYQGASFGTYGVPSEFTKEDKKSAIFAFSKCHISILIYLLIANIFAVLFVLFGDMIFGKDLFESLTQSNLILWIVQILSMYVFGLPFFLIMMRKVPRMEREKSSVSFKEFVILLFIAEAFMLIGAYISTFVTEILNLSLGLNILNSASDLIMNSPLPVVIFTVVIIGPIVEEIIFRKIFIDSLGVYGDRIAIIVSAIAFGLFHGNIDQLIYATMLGALLGYVYTKTGRLVYCCLIHMIVNFFGAVPAMLFEDSFVRFENSLLGLADPGTFDYIVVFGITILQYATIIIGVIAFLVATFKRSYSISNDAIIHIPFFKRPRIILFNLGTIIFLLYSVLSIFLSYLSSHLMGLV